jgi:cell division protein FtsB
LQDLEAEVEQLRSRNAFLEAHAAELQGQHAASQSDVVTLRRLVDSLVQVCRFYLQPK